MTVEVRCDWCREPIEDAEDVAFFESDTDPDRSRSRMGSLFGSGGDGVSFQFHHGSGPIDDSCFWQMCELLRDRAELGEKGLQTGLQWRLVDVNDIPTVKVVGGKYYPLARAGIDTLGDVALRTEAEVAALPGIGAKTVADLRQALETHGLAFADRSPEGVAA